MAVKTNYFICYTTQTNTAIYVPFASWSRRQVICSQMPQLLNGSVFWHSVFHSVSACSGLRGQFLAHINAYIVTNSTNFPPKRRACGAISHVSRLGLTVTGITRARAYHCIRQTLLGSHVAEWDEWWATVARRHRTASVHSFMAHIKYLPFYTRIVTTLPFVTGYFPPKQRSICCDIVPLQPHRVVEQWPVTSDSALPFPAELNDEWLAKSGIGMATCSLCRGCWFMPCTRVAVCRSLCYFLFTVSCI